MRGLMIASALALLASGPLSVAHAQKIDANGRCHAKDGKFAKMEVCKGGSAALTPGAAADPNAPYKLDAKGKCHDVKGRMATKAKCAA